MNPLRGYSVGKAAEDMGTHFDGALTADRWYYAFLVLFTSTGKLAGRSLQPEHAWL